MSDPVVISGNATFDDLEGLDNTPSEVEPVVKEEEVVKADIPAVPEKTEPKEEEKKEIKKDSKKVKGKLGESEIDFDLETLVPVMIDGKEEMVPLSELRNGFSGTKAITKRFSDLDKEKKTFLKEKSEIEGKVEKSKAFYTELEKKLDSENPYDALEYLVEKSGKSSYDFKYNKLLPAMMDEVVTMLQMDEAGRDAYLAKKENEYLKKGKESDEQKLKSEQSHKDFVSKVDAMRETHKVSEDEYVDAHNELAKMGHKDFKPENVIDYVRNLRSVEKSIELIKSIDESKLANKDVVTSVAETIKENPDLTVEEIAAELRTYWGLPNKATEKVGAKVEDAASRSNKTFQKGFESFDDYEK